ncbi:ARF guanine-nucleotide exchange factor GNOM [Platanthera zijinensis]|uniref:ARF guanine-nucleotide exchange factor GNOM n=1 Tax=Platanthera zijinensis TaxID=2320716 RepID=A0AAP0C0E3_9ASPA
MGGLGVQNHGINPTQEESAACSGGSLSFPPQGLNSRADATGHTMACMINSEVSAVLAVMRRNVRWSGRYASADDDYLDHSLIQSLKSLRRQLFAWDTNKWSFIDPILYLRPFLDVIRSEETGAPITGVALSSIHKILSFEVFDDRTANAVQAMHAVVDAVTGCRFEVTDPASEEAVLMKILQLLLACMRCRASRVLSNQHVCTIVNTCFRVVHQARSKGELLQRISRHTMHELVRCIFLHLPQAIETTDILSSNAEIAGFYKEQSFGLKKIGNNKGNVGPLTAPLDDESEGSETQNGTRIMMEPFGMPCMVEIFHFLCSLLNISDQIGVTPRANHMALDEDVPLFALGMINSAIELGGSSVSKHPKLLALIQDELFRNLMQFGLSISPLILSTVCSIVLNLYCHLRMELKLQLEAFFSCVVLRLAEGKCGASYHQQEVALEALVDFCRQKDFMAEMYMNLDSDITCSNVFEEIINLLSRCAFPVNGPLSMMHALALEGLVAVIQGMSNRIGNSPPKLQQTQLELDEYTPFWCAKCEDYSDREHLLKFVRRRKYIKRRLMSATEHFNKDLNKGFEFLQGTHLLPEKLDAKSVACFFRYTAGLDKDIVGDFLGNHDEFSVQVLHEFAGTFDFRDMNLDTALRIFVETFRLPGESQKIQRVLEAFSKRYYEQSAHILVNEDAALLLSYSIILLNTDQHNAQIKKKMTEEGFIRNNRCINGGNDLPREFLSELYQSICKNEIKITPESGFGVHEMSQSRWIDLMRKSKSTSPYIVYDFIPYLDHDMLTIMSGPTIAAICVVFDYAEHDDLLMTCVDGFLAVAKISAYHQLDDVIDDLVISLCKFTTLLSTSMFEEPITAFGDDTKARLATETVFDIANNHGDHIRTGWKNILDCISRLYKVGLLPAHLASDAADDMELPADAVEEKPSSSSLSASHIPSAGIPRKSSGLMGRFSQLLYFDTEELRTEPTEQQLAAHQRALQTIHKCHINSIFSESKFLHADSLLHLARALILVAGRPSKVTGFPDDEGTAVFCLELLITITLNNRDRIVLLWHDVYEHIANIVHTSTTRCALVEKAVFGLLRICQRLLPYKENLTDELLKSLQLVLKLDARVADAYCENITQEVTRLVRANFAHIKSQMGWKTITSLLSITARHPEASEVGFDGLIFIMSEGAHLSPVNYLFCIEASRHFAESRVGLIDRSMRALDLMAESTVCLVRWSQETKHAGNDASKMADGIQDLWLKLVQTLRRMTLDQREEVRNHALTSLQKCMIGVEGICLSPSFLLQSFDIIIFKILDDLLEVSQTQSQKDYANIEGTLVLAMKLLSKVFLQLLHKLSELSSFYKIWLGVLSRMEKFMKIKVRVKKSEKLQELVPELLKNILLVMKSTGILAKKSTAGGDSLWELTWVHMNNFAPSLQSEIFTGSELEQKDYNNQPLPDQSGLGIDLTNQAEG